LAIGFKSNSYCARLSSFLPVIGAPLNPARFWHGAARIGTPRRAKDNEPVSRLADRILRGALTSAHHALKLAWFVRRPRTFGAHAVALTPEGRLILVKLRYAPGWRLPGGGRSEREAPRDAVLRELREEIGMTGHGEVAFACALEEDTDFKRDLASVMVVRDVRYTPPRWSWEVEAVREASLDELPDDLSPVTTKWLSAVQPIL
jgi:8-oxo-dGTP pyrophosphatase MutT (NUDIX family)